MKKVGMSKIFFAIIVVIVFLFAFVPNITTQHHKHEQIAKLRDISVEFQHAFELMNKRGVSFTHPALFLKQYLHIKKFCGYSTTPCFSKTYSSINGKTDVFKCKGGYSAILKNGAAVCLIPATLTSPITVYIDTNGTEPPNTGGRDMFRFQVYGTGTIDEGVNPQDPLIKKGTLEPGQVRGAEAQSCQSSIDGRGCFASLINNNWRVQY